MVRVLTGAQAADKCAHEHYIQHLHLKPSSYMYILLQIQPYTDTIEKGWSLGCGTVWNGECCFF